LLIYPIETKTTEKKPMTIHTSHRTATGTGAFPLDMLRYDHAWPASSDDAAAIAATFRPGFKAHPVTIRITNNGPNHHGEWNPQRWASFGWKLIK